MKDVRVIDSTVQGDLELSIADDDFGVDPYNSTGQHAVLKTRK